MSLRIKEVLKEKGISVIQLSEKLGVTRSACYQYINGNPTAECLERIAIALDVEIGELFDIKKIKRKIRYEFNKFIFRGRWIGPRFS